MKRRLAPEALYNSNSFNEHWQRKGNPGGLHDPNACWNKAAERIREFDPLGLKGLRILQEIESRDLTRTETCDRMSLVR